MFCFHDMNVKKLTIFDKKEILSKINSNNILIFKNQKLSQRQLANFATIFGEISLPLDSNQSIKTPLKKNKDPRVLTLSNIDAEGNTTKTCYNWSAYEKTMPRQTNSIFLWHSDKSYVTNPARYTILYAVDVPKKYGQTQIIDTSLCYRDLPKKLKRKYDQLYAIHDYAYMRKSLNEADLTVEQRQKYPPVIHSLVNTNIHTGEKSIYFGMYCSEIVYHDKNESDKIKKSIYKFCTKNKYIYNHNWEVGDILMWNNLHTMHKACNNYDHKYEKRTLDRVVVK